MFFTDTARLSEVSTLGTDRWTQGPADLYEFELTSIPGQPLRGTPDRSDPGRAPMASADVLGLIPGASEDGIDVYFVANGVLAPGAGEGNARATTAKKPKPPRGRDVQPVRLPDRSRTPRADARRSWIAALSYEDGGGLGRGPDIAAGTPNRISAR